MGSDAEVLAKFREVRDQIEARINGAPGSAMVMQTNPRAALVAVDAAQAKDMPAESVGAVAQVAPTGLYLGGDGAIDGAVDATFDQAYAGGETPKRPDPFAQIAVQTGGACCTPTASGQACC